MGKLERNRPCATDEPTNVKKMQSQSMLSATNNNDMHTFSDKHIKRYCSPVDPQHYESRKVSFSSAQGPVIPRKRAVSLELFDNVQCTQSQPAFGAIGSDDMHTFSDKHIKRFCTPVDPHQYELPRVSFRSSKGPVIPKKRAVSLELFDDVHFTQSQPTLSTTSTGTMHTLSENDLKRFSTPVVLQQSDPHRAAVRFSKGPVIPRKRAVSFEDISIVCW